MILISELVGITNITKFFNEIVLLDVISSHLICVHKTLTYNWICELKILK